jgi:SAM-dependent methyltransferase
MIRQANLYNKGFEHKGGTDFGVDASGQKAQGYQHHDGLWFEGGEEHNGRGKQETDRVIATFTDIFEKFASNLKFHFDPDRVLELGCGSGLMAQIMRERRMEVITADANPVARDHSPYLGEDHFWVRTDQPLDFVDEDGSRVYFDAVVSLEHFEHVPEDTFDTLMENICEHTLPGAALIFTAAQWKYAGDQEHIHCNVKNYDEWKEYLEKFGFEIKEHKFSINRCGDTIEIFAERI